MKLSTIKRAITVLCGPAILSFAKSAYRRLMIARGVFRVATTLEELDREIARMDGASDVDHQLQMMNQLVFDPAWSCSADPFSDEYRQAVMEFYKLYSGRNVYESATNEQFDAPVELLSPHRAFPYLTGSSQIVGQHLMALGFLFQAMQVRPGMTVLEFGPGWGNTTVDLARLGCRVTAVDLNPFFLDLIGQRCRALGLDVDLVRSDMLDYQSQGKFDRILFFESFHHCPDPVRMVRQVGEMLAPGGLVIFAAEPIMPEFSHPWGLRTDGQSAYQIRKRGWMELGFNQGFFEKMISRQGWQVEKVQSFDLLHLGVFVAKRVRGPSILSENSAQAPRHHVERRPS